MKLRTFLAGTVGAVGATAAANRLLAGRADDLEPPLPGEGQTYRWRGFDVAYTTAGDPDDDDLVLLHGINAAASSHTWRSVVDSLAEEFHVIAPDLPGFGHSDRPPLTYSASLYQTFLADFLTEWDQPVVVASTLTGAYAAGVAEEVEASRYVLVCPTTDTIPGRRVWLRTLFRSPLVGEALFNLVVSKPAIRYFHEDHGYSDMSNLDEETVDYEWATAHQPGARFAPASFLSGHLDPELDLGAALAAVDVPVTLVWGTEAERPSLAEGRDLAERADVRLVSIEDSMLVPQAEHPAEFIDVVRET